MKQRNHGSPSRKSVLQNDFLLFMRRKTQFCILKKAIFFYMLYVRLYLHFYHLLCLTDQYFASTSHGPTWMSKWGEIIVAVAIHRLLFDLMQRISEFKVQKLERVLYVHSFQNPLRLVSAGNKRSMQTRFGCIYVWTNKKVRPCNRVTWWYVVCHQSQNYMFTNGMGFYQIVATMA